MKTKQQVILLTIAITAVFGLIVSSQNPSKPAEGTASDSRIVYFTTADENSGGLLAPAHIQEILKARVVRSWAEVIEINERGGLDALILGEDVISEVPGEELSRMYQNALVVVVFNTYAPTLTVLVSDECIGKDGWMDGNDPYKSDFFIIVSKLFQGSLKAQHQLRNQNSCDVNISFDSVDGFSGIYGSMAQNELVSAADFDVFAQVLLLAIQNINSYKTDIPTAP